MGTLFSSRGPPIHAAQVHDATTCTGIVQGDGQMERLRMERSVALPPASKPPVQTTDISCRLRFLMHRLSEIAVNSDQLDACGMVLNATKGMDHLTSIVLSIGRRAVAV